MKKIIMVVVFSVLCGWTVQAMACGIAGKSGTTEGSGTNLASEYGLSGK